MLVVWRQLTGNVQTSDLLVLLNNVLALWWSMCKLYGQYCVSGVLIRFCGRWSSLNSILAEIYWSLFFDVLANVLRFVIFCYLNIVN